METPSNPSLSMSQTGAGPAVRFPAPDVARGFMLLLIALANVYWWFPSSLPDNSVDQWWVVLRTALIDQRSYPLFAILFGYGLALIALRRKEAGVDEGPVRRLLRRRGWWMLAIGFVHAIVFGGDIIGAYALIAIITAGVIAGRKFRGLAVFGVAVWLVAFLFEGIFRLGDQSQAKLPVEPGSADLAWIPFNLFLWVLNTPLTVVVSMIVPAAVIGVWIAQTSLLSEPEQHRPLLRGVAVGGLAIGFAGGFTAGLYRSGLADGLTPVWASSINSASQLFGAVGWLGVAALIGAAVRDRVPASPFSPLGLVLAVGRRSMTAYLLQTVVFLGIVVALRASGIHGELSLVAIAGIAVGVWLLIAIFCAALESRGYPGPSEQLLRRLVARTASAHDKALLTGQAPPEQTPPTR